jgi:hypothetical protein
MAHADRLVYLNQLQVKGLRSDDIQVLGQLPCLIYLRLKAKKIPEKNIIIHPNTFPCLEHFHFSCELSYLDIHLHYGGESAIHLKEGSLVGGIEQLASIEKIFVDINAKYDHDGSQIESAWRDAINRHPKSQTIYIYVNVKGKGMLTE